ncbi:MAG: glycosyltransferase family 4 protein [Acidobacteriota bacterium]
MIAIVYPQFYGVQGIARYVDSFLANLPSDSPDILLITGDAGPNAKTYRRVQIVNIPISDNRLGLTLWRWKVRRRLAALLDEGVITSINLHIPPLIPGLFLAHTLPIVLTAHTTYVGMSGRFDGNKSFRSPWNPLSLWLKIQMERIIIAKSDAVISLTEQGRQELALYDRRDRIAIIPNGVDISKFTSTADVTKDIDVIFSGRIEKRKGSRPLVEVCRRLVEANRKIRIAIVGYGDDEDHVRSELQAFPDNILLTGKVPFHEMVAYYRRSRVYASTSYYEGLPGTCLEAMATGLPTVVWDLLFYRELVVDGVTGRVAKTNDYAGMVEQVNLLLSDPGEAASMGQRGQALIREKYDWQRLSRQVLDVLEGVAKQDTALHMAS